MEIRSSKRLAAKPKTEAVKKTSPKKDSAAGAAKKTVRKQKVVEEKKAASPVKEEAKVAATTKNSVKTIPKDLKVVDENGTEHLLADLFQDKPGVIFFYPKANTPGCTTQACGFRDMYAEIEAKGFQVFGMSADSPTSQMNWKNKHSFQYSLLSDRTSDRKVLKWLGVNKGASISRSHVVIAQGGIVQESQIGISPKESIELARKTILG